MELPKKKLTVADGIVIALTAAAIIIFAFFSLTSHDADRFTVTTPAGSSVYSLDESGILSLTQNEVHVTIVYENGEVRIEDSDCPDLTCIRTGSISKPGEVIVCVPAELVITIPYGESEESDEIYIVG